VGDPGGLQLCPDVGQLPLVPGRLVGVQVLAAAVGVDHDQPGVAEPALLGRPVQRGPALRGGHVPDDDRHRYLLERAGL
jgi:hypothetical protein